MPRVKAERTEGQELALALHRIAQALERLASAHERRADAAEAMNKESDKPLRDMAKVFEASMASIGSSAGAERHV